MSVGFFFFFLVDLPACLLETEMRLVKYTKTTVKHVNQHDVSLVLTEQYLVIVISIKSMKKIVMIEKKKIIFC